MLVVAVVFVAVTFSVVFTLFSKFLIVFFKSWIVWYNSFNSDLTTNGNASILFSNWYSRFFLISKDRVVNSPLSLAFLFLIILTIGLQIKKRVSEVKQQKVS